MTISRKPVRTGGRRRASGRLACRRTCRSRRRPGRLILLAAGKAAGSMTEVAERHYLDERALPPDRIAGIAVARHGYGRPTRVVRMIEAGHPVPDAAGLDAAERDARARRRRRPDDLVLVLMSGGASANWIAPAAGLALAEKQAVTRALLRSGATIGEINTVRKHLSRIKGGRLARARASGAGRHARDLGRAGRRSGGDRLGADRARSHHACGCARDRRALSARRCRRACTRALTDPANETPEARRSGVRRHRSSRSPRGRPMRSRAAEAAVRAAGYECILLGDRARRRGARGRGRACAARARTAGARPPRRDPVGRRTDRHACAARAAAAPTRNTRWRWRIGARRHCRASRRSPATPTAPTAAAAPPTTRPGPWSTARRVARAARARPRSGRLSCRQQFDRILRERSATC